INASFSIMAAGQQPGAEMGRSVASAGDVNGDGRSDVLLGMPRYDHPDIDEGGAFLWYGGGGTLYQMVQGEAAWSAEGNQGGAYYGYSAATAGDVNGDGYSDIIVG